MKIPSTTLPSGSSSSAQSARTSPVVPVTGAPWSAKTDPSDAYGYAIFDVDPGNGPGETTITFQYFAIPAVTDEATPQHDGTTTLPTTPFEKFVFGRGLGAKKYTPPAFATATA